jgi:hypothetical protein
MGVWRRPAWTPVAPQVRSPAGSSEAPRAAACTGGPSYRSSAQRPPVVEERSATELRSDRPEPNSLGTPRVRSTRSVDKLVNSGLSCQAHADLYAGAASRQECDSVTNRSSLPRGCGYRVTQAGHDASIDTEVCSCTLRLQGLMFACPECGTVWALLRGLDNPATPKFDRKATR